MKKKQFTHPTTQQPNVHRIYHILCFYQIRWGLNTQIKKVADRFAAAGFRALVPDFYRGKVAQNADEVFTNWHSLSFSELNSIE
jgi:dienelactone hydrolase